MSCRGRGPVGNGGIWKGRSGSSLINTRTVSKGYNELVNYWKMAVGDLIGVKSDTHTFQQELKGSS